MEQVFVRGATAGDAGAISLLNLTSLGLRYAADKTRTRLGTILQNPAHLVLVATSGTRVVGYLHANLCEMTFTPTLCEVICLAVHSDSRGCGVGRMLMEACEAWAREKGAGGIRLTSGFERAGGHKFYAAIGFENTRECKEFYKNLGENTL